MKILFTVMICLMLSGTAWAEEIHPAEHVVRTTTSDAVSVLAEEKSLVQIEQLVGDVILPNFDFIQMSRWVLGKTWQTMSEQQRVLFTEQFQKMLVGTYTAALIEFDNQHVDVQPVIQSKNPKLVFVPTVITQANADPLEIRYMMMQGEQDCWKVVDMMIDGVSLIKNYRASYAAQIRREGVDTLIEKLVAKNQTENI